jgi:hypothetical protein
MPNRKKSVVDTSGATLIGVREFRANLAGLLRGNRQLRIGAKGKILGYYFPAPRPISKKTLDEVEAWIKPIAAAAAKAGITDADL